MYKKNAKMLPNILTNTVTKQHIVHKSLHVKKRQKRNGKKFRMSRQAMRTIYNAMLKQNKITEIIIIYSAVLLIN